MNIDSSEILGTGLVISTGLLGAYYLVLKIRDFHSEKPDPKLTYATQSQLEKTRAELMEAISQAVRDVRGLRAEIRADTFAFQERHDKGLSETRELVSKNAQNISALIAQAQLANQRIGELTLKTDKLSLRISKQ